MIYIEIHHQEPEYISAYVEAIAQDPAGKTRLLSPIWRQPCCGLRSAQWR